MSLLSWCMNWPTKLTAKIYEGLVFYKTYPICILHFSFYSVKESIPKYEEYPMLSFLSSLLVSKYRGSLQACEGEGYFMGS